MRNAKRWILLGVCAAAAVVLSLKYIGAQKDSPPKAHRYEIVDEGDLLLYRPIQEDTAPEPVKLDLSYDDACKEYLPAEARTPSWCPDAYTDSQSELMEYEGITNVSSIFYGETEDNYLILTVADCPYVLSENYGDLNGEETYLSGGVLHYLWNTDGRAENNPAVHAIWGEGSLAYYVAGTFSMETLKEIIDSMYPEQA